MPAVQKRAFPLAGLLANVNPQNPIKPEAGRDGLLSIVMVQEAARRNDNFRKLQFGNLTKPDIKTAVMMTNDDISNLIKPKPHGVKPGITAPANSSPSFFRRGDEESFVTSTRGEFLESIKKGLPTIANPVYGYSAPAKSGAGIGLPVMIKATYDAPSVFFCVVNSVHLFFSVAGIIRAAHKIMVGCVGASSEAPVSLIAGKTNSAQSTTSKIGLFGGGFKTQIKEAANMATTPTQNSQFIWLIAAVRRDCPTIRPAIHHIAAATELEARRTLSRDHVCFFAGRIRVEVAA